MNITFDEIVNSKIENLEEYIISPATPYLLCDHFISIELNIGNPHYINSKIAPKANDLLKNKNYNDIKNLEIIQVQVNYLDFFCDEILPILKKKNIKVVIITSQLGLPQVTISDKTDIILNNEQIILWVSQNPIYSNHEKYMAFPYGILHTYLNMYFDFIRSCNVISNYKHIKILNQYASVHSHLPEDHIRRKFNIFTPGMRMDYKDFLTNIANSQFVISTAGDRDDCFRHYESIGLNAIPVSNITGGYKEIFGENMIYSNAEEMINMIQTNCVVYEYKKPNRELLTISYWSDKMKERITNALTKMS